MSNPLVKPTHRAHFSVKRRKKISAQKTFDLRVGGEERGRERGRGAEGRAGQNVPEQLFRLHGFSVRTLKVIRADERI
jgi:hypothetical protein